LEVLQVQVVAPKALRVVLVDWEVDLEEFSHCLGKLLTDCSAIFQEEASSRALLEGYLASYRVVDYLANSPAWAEEKLPPLQAEPELELEIF
jgi:hypothetical protein